jgi:hypothetical protein
MIEIDLEIVEPFLVILSIQHQKVLEPIHDCVGDIDLGLRFQDLSVRGPPDRRRGQSRQDTTPELPVKSREMVVRIVELGLPHEMEQAFGRKIVRLR